MPTIQQRPNWRVKRRPGTAFNVPSRPFRRPRNYLRGLDAIQWAVGTPANWRTFETGLGVGSLLVNEISGPDTNLASHPDVIWYATPSRTIDTDLIGTATDQWHANWIFSTPWYLGPGDEGTNGGRATHTYNATYGVYVSRFGSWFKEDHCNGGFSGTTVTYQACTPNPLTGLTIMSMRKWFTQARAELDGTAPSGKGGLGTTPVTEVYLRFMAALPTDIETYMDSAHHKFPGLESGTGTPPIWGYGKPGTIGAPAGSVMLTNYAGSYTGLPSSDHTPLGVTLPLGNDFHCFEQYAKLNSSASASDGIFRQWVDDVLVHDSTGSYYTSTPSSEVGFGYIHAQIFLGGQALSNIPTGSLHHSVFGFTAARRRVGKAKTI